MLIVTNTSGWAVLIRLEDTPIENQVKIAVQAGQGFATVNMEDLKHMRDCLSAFIAMKQGGKADLEP